MTKALLMLISLVLSQTRRIRSFHIPQSASRGTIRLFYSTFDVIVVGGGHAGCEAATAAARTGARTALVTQRLDTVGELSCNPSIGGIGKGHLVREIDALDGVMGEVADIAGIHFRILNRRKGPAVRGPRAQMDRDLYKSAMQEKLRNYENLEMVQASVQDLLLDESKAGFNVDPIAPLSSEVTGTQSDDRIREEQRILDALSSNNQKRSARIQGVVVERDDGTSEEIFGKTVVITTGTFLRGVLLLGHERHAGGRHLRDSEKVEPPSVGLANTLVRFEFPLGRLKTGTPARVDGRTIDWEQCVKQPSEIPATPFSHLRQFREEQPPQIQKMELIDCYQTQTNQQTHDLVLKYEDTLPIYDGMEGKGNGPRYCPSIYKKVQRFPERSGHNSFLEPEGLNTDLVYPNGMSGPYPPEIQEKILRTMKGLGAVEIVRPGYDVEYDYVNPQCLTHTLENKKISGLYLAGQICGTTGYEEAGAQGIVAGANAGRCAVAAREGQPAPAPFVVGRDEGYIGVLVDDLVTKGTSEPYRMFTSRAEYRISLRADNADLRLTQKGLDFGLVRSEERISTLEAREDLILDRIDKLKAYTLKVSDWAAKGGDELMGGANMAKKPGMKKSAEQVLAMPQVTLSDVESVVEEVQAESGDTDLLGRTPGSVHDTVEAALKYKQYVKRQHKDMASWRKAQGVRIPPDVEYNRDNLPTLKAEEIEKLEEARPSTFAEASQISGMRPQSLIYLYHYVTNRNREKDDVAAKKAVVSA